MFGFAHQPNRRAAAYAPARAPAPQLWNDEPIMDRYLGCIDLPIEIFMDVRTFGGGRRQWFPFDSEVSRHCCI